MLKYDSQFGDGSYSEEKLLLVEHNSDEINNVIRAPIANLSRIHYTTMAVNQNLLVLGSSSGSVYVFMLHSKSLKYLYCVPNNQGRINCASLAPYQAESTVDIPLNGHPNGNFLESNDKNPEKQNMLAVGTSRGSVIIIILSTTYESTEIGGGKILYCCRNFTSSAIRHIKWNTSDMLWMSDDSGNIFMINRIQSLSTFLIPQNPILVLKLEHAVCEMDCYNDYLALSTQNRSLVYSLSDSSIKQIGSKPRPQGLFGIAFFPREDKITGRPGRCIYAARPRARLWEAQLDGYVNLTHQFKAQIYKTDSSPIYSQKFFETSQNGFQSLKVLPSCPNFTSLGVVSLQLSNRTERHLLLATSQGIEGCLFVIDPISAELVTWTNQLPNFDELHSLDGGEIFLFSRGDENIPNFSSSSNTVRRISFRRPFDLFQELLDCGGLDTARGLIEEHFQYFRFLSRKDSLVKTKLKSFVNKLGTTDDSNGLRFDFLSDSLEEKELNKISRTEPQRSLPIDFNDPTLRSLPNFHSNNCKEDITQYSKPKVKIYEGLYMLVSQLKKDVEHLLESKCICGYPIPGSHKVLKVEEDIYENFSYSLDPDIRDKKDDLIKETYEAGFWSAHCHLLLDAGQYEEYIRISLALNDLTLLESQKFLEYLKSCPDAWKIIFQTFYKKFSTQSMECLCPKCSYSHKVASLQWNNLFRFMSSNLTPSQTIKALEANQTSLPEGVVSPHFCLSLIKSHSIFVYQRSRKKESPVMNRNSNQ